MKLIKPSFEILSKVDGEDILKEMEIAARTCYKSEGKIEYSNWDDTRDCPSGILDKYDIDNQGLDYYAKSARKLMVKLIGLGHSAMLEFGGSITVKFVCDRGISHELVRHRIASFAQESTRYCNYGKGEHMQYIIPPWLSIMPGICNLWEDYDNFSEFDGTLAWLDSLHADEVKYNHLINQLNPKTGKVDLRFRKWTPQEARSVLPNSLKTEINVSANIREWRHIFNQRCAKAAHPQMRELMIPLLEEFKSLIPVLFDDIDI